MRDEKRLVYSTDGEHSTSNRPSKPPKSRGQASIARSSTPPDDGYVRIRREKAGRGGKTATTVTGVPGSAADLDALLKTLKHLCGAGGTRDGNTIEVQGDHRDRIEAKLLALGHRVKRAGG